MNEEKKYGTAVVYDEKGNVLLNISEIDEIREEANKIIKKEAEHFGLSGFHTVTPFSVRTILQIMSDRGLLKKYDLEER